jgi:hypothetical protein
MRNSEKNGENINLLREVVKLTPVLSYHQWISAAENKIWERVL